MTEMIAFAAPTNPTTATTLASSTQHISNALNFILTPIKTTRST
ncbi:hypothetical protein [Ruegeria sp.]